MRAMKTGAGEDDAEDLDDEELRKMEMDRIEERLTLRHKNTSRWARRALKRGMSVMDEGTKQAINEQLRLAQELKRKAEGRGSGSDSDGSDEETESDGGGAADRHAGLSSKAKRAALEILEGGGDEMEEAVMNAKKGLFSMPFMRKAMERRQNEAREQARAALAGDAADGEPAAESLGGGRAGRMNFSGGSEPRAPAARADDDGTAADGNEEGLVNLGDGDGDGDGGGGDLREAVRAARAEIAGERGLGGAPGDADNAGEGAAGAWGEVHTAVETEGFLTVGGKEGAAAVVATSGAAGSRRTRGKGAAADPAPAPAAPVADPSAGFVPAKKFSGSRPGFVFQKGPRGLGYYPDPAGAKPSGRRAAGGGKGPVTVAGEAKAGAGREAGKVPGASGGHAAADGQGRGQGRGPGAAPAAAAAEGDDVMQLAVRGADQARLIQAAFAGDDVEAEFAAEKAKDVEGELPKVETPAVMPGWGKWNADQREPRWMVAQREKAEKMKADAAKVSPPGAPLPPRPPAGAHSTRAPTHRASPPLLPATSPPPASTCRRSARTRPSRAS